MFKHQQGVYPMRFNYSKPLKLVRQRVLISSHSKTHTNSTPYCPSTLPLVCSVIHCHCSNHALPPTHLPINHPPTYPSTTHPPTHQPPTHLPINHPPTYPSTTHTPTHQPPTHTNSPSSSPLSIHLLHLYPSIYFTPIHPSTSPSSIHPPILQM